MSTKIKSHPFVEENISISNDKKAKKDKDKNPPLIRKSDSDKNDIIIELSHKKQEEDEKSSNSAEFSGQLFNAHKQKEKEFEEAKAKTFRSFPIKLSKKGYENYTQRLKEKTMRKELEKIQKETERIKKIYEEKNSFLHLFDNNPQFQKMLKMVEKQLRFILFQGILIFIFGCLIYFKVSNRKSGLALGSMSISISEIAFIIILFISLKIGLLNDPELSKAFRVFVIIECLMIISSFIINILIPFFIIKRLKKLDNYTIKLLVYILFLLMMISFIITFKQCYNLFVESIYILLNKKTEYSILMVNEKNNNNETNTSTNLTASNSMSTDAINNSSVGIFGDNQSRNNNLITKEEEQYRNYKNFSTFHYSVTSDRKDNKYFKNKAL
jgi:hypothetical protein